MTKDEIQTICNSVYKNILSTDYKTESLKEKLLTLSSNGQINSEKLSAFILFESQKFTVKMIQNVLCEILASDEKASENLSTDK